MQDRFQEPVEDENYIRPELAEQIIERFAERERLRQLEQERLASMTRVEDLASLLGTTPEDIAKLAAETSVVDTVRSEEELNETANRAGQWVIGILGGSFLFLCFVLAIRSPRQGSEITVGAPSPSFQVPASTGVDSTWNTREIATDTAPAGLRRPPLSVNGWPDFDAALRRTIVKEPPAGVTIQIYSGDLMFATGHFSKNPSLGAGAAADICASIRSLMAYQEARFELLSAGEVLPFKDVPMESTASVPGWHRLCLLIGGNTVNALLPDRRYYLSNPGYETEVNRRLNWVTGLLDKRAVKK